MTDEFGHWLAGFAAGEGCFGISAYKGRAAHSCFFAVVLRDDDRSILDECQQQTGIGIVSAKRPPSIKGRWGAQAQWRVRNKDECLELVRIFDRFPLRAKKADDFAIWREAVFAWNAFAPYSKQADWSRMAELREHLMQMRAYQPSPTFAA